MRQPGSTLGPYVVESLLAEGGMGAVYRAKNRVTGQLRAIKVVRPELVEKRDFVDRFVREATIASQLRHPNLVETLEPGIDGTVIYLPMELLEGDTLSVHLKRKKRLTPAEAAEILVPVSQAVQLLHDKGVVHRDLKPMNIFITRGAGGAIVPKVIDLGTARDVDGDDEHTRTGMVVGSPFYMAPEQAEGRRDIDGRADQYALGVIAYQMITGARPYESDDTRSALAKLLRGEPYVPPSRYFPGLHPSVEAVIVRALARERDRRFARIDEFGRALTDAAAGLPVPSAALPPPAIVPAGIHEVPTAPPGLDVRGPGAPASMPPPGAPTAASPLGTPGPFAPPPDGTPAPTPRATGSRAPLMIGAVVVLALLGAGAAALTWSMSPTMTATPLAPRATSLAGSAPEPPLGPVTITTTPAPTAIEVGAAGATPDLAGVGAAGTTATGTDATAPSAAGSAVTPSTATATGTSTGTASTTTGGTAAAPATSAGTVPATTETASPRGTGGATTGATAGTPSTTAAGASTSGTARTTPSTAGSRSGTSGERTGSSTAGTSSGGSSGTTSSGGGSSRGSSSGTRHDDDDDDDERGGGASHGAPCGAATGIPCLE